MERRPLFSELNRRIVPGPVGVLLAVVISTPRFISMEAAAVATAAAVAAALTKSRTFLPLGLMVFPEWQRLLEAALAGAAGAAINQALDAALAKVYDGAIYRMEAPCDKDADGNPLVWEKQIPPAPSTDALGYRLTAIHEQISQALAWKTPICNEQPEPEGDYRTIHFRSASPSPFSSSRLRKRFRYRSTSGLGLDEITNYWKDFTFESGPVVVKHVGSSLGRPQVWAATEDEGKRVIRHAFGEAGIDPDQVGRWLIGSSDSPRLGVSDTMSVDNSGGYYMIKYRDGSDGPSYVA